MQKCRGETVPANPMMPLRRIPVRRPTKKKSISSSRLNPELFLHPCYKLDAVVNGQDTPLNFLASDSQWDQPEGPGSAITVTYSYSNLLDGNMQGLTSDQLRLATEEAMSLWATVAPINFVEIFDVGPTPSADEDGYSTGDSADIRIGAHVMDGVSGGELAHAYLPYSSSAGLAGDLHFDVDEDWGQADGGFFLETMLHELGHVLGLDHVDDVEAIMNPVIMNRFNGLGESFLLDDDIAGVQSVYGAGSVTALPEEPADPDDEEEEPEEPTSANNVTVEMDEETGVVTLTGDEMDNDVMVLSSWWFTIVQGYNGTTVNGESMAYWRRSRESSIEITASNGDDAVYLFGVNAESTTVDLGAGDDLLAIIFSRIDSVESDGGDGKDSLLAFFNRIGELIESGFETL